jgi:hypothetical protein
MPATRLPLCGTGQHWRLPTPAGSTTLRLYVPEAPVQVTALPRTDPDSVIVGLEVVVFVTQI